MTLPKPNKRDPARQPHRGLPPSAEARPAPAWAPRVRSERPPLV